MEQLPIDAANIFLVDIAAGCMNWVAGCGFDTIPKQLDLHLFPQDMLHESLPQFNLQQQDNHHPLQVQCKNAGFQACMMLPLVYNDVLLGMLDVMQREAHPLSEDYIAYLETVAGQAAIAIEHVSAFTNLQYMVNELSETKDALEKSQCVGHIGSWRYKTTYDRIEWSQELYKIYGLKSKKTIPTYETLFENILPEDLQRVRRQTERLFQGQNIDELQYRIIRPDGKIRHLIMTCEAFHDKNDQIKEIIGTVRDRSEHKQAELALNQAHLSLKQAYDTTLEGWARALDLRDHSTEGHSQRVTRVSLQLARLMGIPEEELVHIRRGALLHDIGKIGIPDHILLKPGPLSAEEWELMRKHPQYAYDLLSPIPYLLPAMDIPYCHHEKWDGTGYPRGLKGTDIPLSARIFAIVDVLDALTSDRPYREAWSLEKARDYVVSQSGTHFDPDIVKVLQANWNKIKF